MTRFRDSYVVGRFFRLLLTIWLGTTLIFVIPRLATSDPTDAILGRMASSGSSVGNSAAVIATYKDEFGLGKPVFVQYLLYLKDMITFHNGYSLADFPANVGTLIGNALPWTLGLVGVATVVSFVVGTWIGALLGWRDTPKLVRRTLPASLVFTSLPPFMVGIVLLAAFSYRFGWFPSSGAYNLTVVPGFNFPFLADVVVHATLPALAIILVTLGDWALSMRGMMVATTGEDYVTLAKANGVKPQRIFWSYGVRNASLPQVTSLGVALAQIVGGVVVVEAVFDYPGVGGLLYNAILNNDYPVIEGVSFYLIVGVSCAVFVLDLIYPLLDPRISHRRVRS